MKDADQGIAGELSGEGLRIAIVRARFNDAITRKLAEACYAELERLDVDAGDIRHVTVPGALEVPVALNALADSGDFDALIALGCIIRGETYHFELVANESGAGVSRVAGHLLDVAIWLPRDAFRLVAASCVHDGDVHAFLCQRVADALAEAAIAAGYQGDGAFEFHGFSPFSGGAGVPRSFPVCAGSVGAKLPGGQAIGSQADGGFSGGAGWVENGRHNDVYRHYESLYAAGLSRLDRIDHLTEWDFVSIRALRDG